MRDIGIKELVHMAGGRMINIADLEEEELIARWLMLPRFVKYKGLAWYIWYDDFIDDLQNYCIWL